MQTRHSGRPAQTAAWGGEPSFAEATASGELAPTADLTFVRPPPFVAAIHVGLDCC